MATRNALARSGHHSVRLTSPREVERQTNPEDSEEKKKPAIPDAPAPAFSTDFVHAVVPVACSDERQAMVAENAKTMLQAQRMQCSSRRPADLLADSG